MTHTETEVKIAVPDLAAVESRLQTLGAEQLAPRVFERNVRYEDAVGSLSPAGKVLRLRMDTRARLTFKAERDATNTAVNIREELEVEVSDFDTADLILNRLGFQSAWTYEKYRTTYRFGGCEVDLDELPYGTFVEIEGEETAIRAALEALQLANRVNIPASYSTLFFTLKARLGVAFNDLTFANFDGVTLPDDWLNEV